MRIAIGNFRLYITAEHIEPKKKKPKVPYSGIICDVCGQTVKGATKGSHIMANHPEYACKVVHPGVSYGSYLAYECLSCGKVLSGVATMVRHYREYHSEKLGLTPNEKEKL